MSRLNNLRQRLVLHLAAAVLVASVEPALALESDQAQPMRITADQALRDEKKGVTVYKGNVRMDQGSLHVDADRITIYHDRESADRVIATGAPARLQQQPDPEKGPMHASARRIEYLRASDQITLRGEASIEQDGSTVTGEKIEYFISEQRVIADSDQSVEGSRVEVIIPARQLQQNNDNGE